MVDVVSIQGAIGSLSLAFDLTKKFLKMKTVAEVQGIVIDLQSEILSAQNSAIAVQASQSALIAKIRDLKEEVARVKAWEEQKQRYALVHACGTVTYALKEDCKGTEPPHWICTKCYEDGIKSILNPCTHTPGAISFCCPRCKAVITSWENKVTTQYATFPD